MEKTVSLCHCGTCSECCIKQAELEQNDEDLLARNSPAYLAAAFEAERTRLKQERINKAKLQSITDRWQTEALIKNSNEAKE